MMPRTAIRDAWLRARACGNALLCGVSIHSRLRLFAALLSVLVLVLSAPVSAEPVIGEATLSKPGEYARLMIKLQTEVEAQVSLAGPILIIRFKRPVDVSVDKLAATLPDYIGSARIDPDGAAIRLALNRKITPNVMAAGERLFVDLLPDSWTGMPPGLPADVVKELADRARAAEQQLRLQKLAADAQKRPLIRVKASRQPTFVRYVFDLSGGANVSTIFNDSKLVLNFTPAVMFDLADAQLVASTNVVAISQKTAPDSATVTFDLVGDVDVHSFREEKTYVVDIGFEPDDKSKALLNSPAGGGEEKPQPPRTEGAISTKPTPANSRVVQPVQFVAQDETPKPPTSKPRELSPQPPVEHGSEVSVTRPTPTAVESVLQEKPATLPAAVQSDKPVREDTATAIQVKRSSAGMRLFVPFALPTAGAVFGRGDTIWLLFDGEGRFNVDQIKKEGGDLVRDATTVALEGGRAIRLRLGRPQLSSVSVDGTTWIIDLSDVSQAPSQPLVAVRNIVEAGRGAVSIPMAAAGRLLKLTDPDAGDVLMVVTAALPARGFVRRQNFVDFSLLESAHGVVVQPNSDDLRIEVAVDKVALARPGGLTLSTAQAAQQRANRAPAIFDTAVWKANRDAKFSVRLNELMTAAATSTGDQRVVSHIELARFYLAYALYPEAKGLLDALFAETKPGPDDAAAVVLHAVANILRGDPDSGLAELGSPIVGASYDSQLWKAVAYARQGKWSDARDKFKGAEFAIGSLPVELQRVVIADELRAAFELRDYTGVSSLLNDLDVVGAQAEMKPALALMHGRVNEALGKEQEALSDYARVVNSDDRASAAAARVEEIALRLKRNDIAYDDALAALETLAMTWRGDATEVRTQQLLAQLYAGAGRYRDALIAARVATKVQANSEVSRQLQDNAATLFSDIFLGQKGDDLPPVQALALFYEFSELTPIGRRGDELIRRLAERLVAIDLLDQAGELLQYQIDQRLDGAARAQVASRLAMIYLMNRKPDRAIAVLRSSRVSDLAAELRTQRLLIEARAQSDIGRSDLALDIIANLSGREVVRLRSDIHWAARHWRESSEQIELMYGDRWRDFKPLTVEEKGDIIRAGIGYSLAEDQIGAARLREKYAAKMEDDSDKAAFDAATKPTTANSTEFVTIAKMAASVDTLGGFVRDMKVRFPDVVAKAPLPNERVQADPSSTGSLPKIQGLRSISRGMRDKDTD